MMVYLFFEGAKFLNALSGGNVGFFSGSDDFSSSVNEPTP